MIPARGGSKGIPRKNLRRVGNDTLLERAIKLSRKCRYIDHTVVSTDDPEMYEMAAKYNSQAPSLRPAKLASDSAKTVDVVLHLMEELRIHDAYIVLLQATSPLRTLEDLNALCEEFEDNSSWAEAIVSLTEHDSPHPDKIQRIDGGYVRSYLGSEPSVPRQVLPKVYALNGAFYLTHSEILMRERTFLPKRTIPFIMPRERSFNLDSMLDLHIVEAIIASGLVTLEEYD